MKCENRTLSSAAYWLGGQRIHEPCKWQARWEVSVNPSTPTNDGKVRLCDHCNRFDYQTFPRAELVR